MTQSFNLIDQPWIPCETLEGEIKPLSLRDTLARAAHLRGICGDSPLETAALYRLLLTVLHRVFGPLDVDAWFALWRAGQWYTARLDDYWEAWYDHFDLLHPDEHLRFYQRKPLEGKSTPIIHLVHSSGNNAALFSHVTDTNQPGMLPAKAARSLVAAQAFRVGGLLKPGLSGPDSPSTRGITFIAEGYTLFETTLFNLWMYWDNHFVQVTGIPQTASDAPAWEQDDVFGSSRTLPLGYLDYLSWQSYRLWLEGTSTEGLIQEVQLGLGQPKLANTVFDPFKHHRAIKKSSQNLSGHTPLRFNEDRALWRDSATILEQAQTSQGMADKRPYCITWLDTLFGQDEGELQGYERLPVMALGMASDQAKIDFYRQERMPIPTAYLLDRQLVSSLKGGLDRAKQVRDALSKALYRLAKLVIAPNADAPDGRSPRREDIQPLVDHWNVERQYWGALEPAFWQFVADLPHREAANTVWIKTLLQVARNAYASAEELAGSDARALKAAAAGRGTLEWHLADMRKEIMQ